MAMSKEDYFLSLVMDMDNTKAKAAFQELQKALGDVKTAELAVGSATTIKERIEREKELAQIKHRLLLEELRVQGDPSAVRERQRRDRELLDIRRTLSQTEAAQRGMAGVGGTLGGTVGMALGGPAGAAAGAQIGQAIGGSTSIAVRGFQALSNSLSSLSGTLGPLNIGFGALDLALPGVGTGIKAITESLTRMGEVASPSVMKQFTMAVEDVMGVIGQSFLPVLELMTDGVKMWGDIIAEIIPNMDEMREILKPLQQAFAEMANAVRDLMAELGPMIRDVLIEGLTIVTNTMAMLARALTAVLRPAQQFLHFLRLWWGGGEATTAPRTAGGAAARAVHMEGFAAYQRRLQETAFREPGGVTAADVPKMTQEIQNNTERMARWSDTFTPERLGRAIADELDARRGNAAARDAVRNGRNGGAGGGNWDAGEGGGNW